jgi:hypothetical protein
MIPVLLFFGGALTLAALIGLGIVIEDLHWLWGVVHKYGGEDPKNLTRFGRTAQWVLLRVSRVVKRYL